ncbi:hypothetical protein [Algoriphagus chordae]|uniref:DUF4440 domain-containing protein n=1 Tax=Algoriphagus chordae TaxID=237019 RepID=A0A2W7S702_9BACT|nr:hypothetical protein [Algoriphagus chordae]PZX46342.1 hypothetical protein LV85_04363 [Algoriphagus chordae]
MKYIYLILLILCFSCNSDNAITETEKIEFEKMAQDWHNKYVQGSVNLADILAGMDENIDMWENGKVWTYKQVEKFGPHLPKKNVLETYNDQKLLKKDLGYDYVSQKYISTMSGDTMRETSSRLWELKNGNWKIVQMNNLIKKEVD